MLDHIWNDHVTVTVNKILSHILDRKGISLEVMRAAFQKDPSDTTQERIDWSRWLDRISEDMKVIGLKHEDVN